MIRGLDVSQVQGAVDWPRVAAAGFRFVVVKTSEGPWADPMARKNLAGARAAGLVDGVYAYARMSLGAPEPQVVALWNAMGDTMSSLPPALDLENCPNGTTPAQIVEWAERWILAAEDRFGRAPMLYTFPYFERSMMGALAPASPIIEPTLLWMADYSGGEAPPDGWNPFTPAPWTTWTMAQTSGNNSSLVPGISWHVDHNVFHGDETDFARLRGVQTLRRPTRAR